VLPEKAPAKRLRPNYGPSKEAFAELQARTFGSKRRRAQRRRARAARSRMEQSEIVVVPDFRDFQMTTALCTTHAIDVGRPDFSEAGTIGAN
jgi:hypothetical protein